MDLGIVVLRLAVGLALAAHGAQKLFGWFDGPGMDRTAAGLAHLGFRNGRIAATMAGATEAGGGFLLALGALSPLAAAACMGVMMVATWTTTLRNGFVVNKGGYEYNLVLIAGAFAVAGAGPGRYSIDHAFGLDLAGGGWAVGALSLAIVGAGLELLIAWRRPAPAGPAPSAGSSVASP